MTDARPPELMAHLWTVYQDEAYGHALPPGQQHTECKRAFYAGAAKAIMALTHLSSEGAEPTQADIDLLDTMMEEVAVFFQAETITHAAMKH